jgi:hypothetical protein
MKGLWVDHQQYASGDDGVASYKTGAASIQQHDAAELDTDRWLRPITKHR